MNGKDRYKNNVFWLGVVSLLADASSEMISAVMPLFLANTLGASGLIIGLIEGLGKAAERLLSFVFGWYSDRIGKRRPVIAAGYLLSTLMKGAFAFTSTWPQFLMVRTAERTGKAIRDAPRDALLAASTSSSIKGRRAGFALHRMLDTIGSIIGPLIALAVIAALATDFENTARTLFSLAVIPGLLAVLVILFLVKEPRIPESKRNHKSLKKSFSLNYGPQYRKFLFAMVPFFLFTPQIAFLYLQAQNTGLVLSSIVGLGFVFGIFYLIGAGSLSFISRYARIGKEKGVDLSLILMFAAFLIVALIQTINHNVATYSIEIFAFAFVLYSIGMGMFEVESKSYLSLLVKEKEMAGAFGSYQTVTGVMIILSGLIFGFLWDVSTTLSFYAAAFATLLAYVIFKIRN